VLSFQFFYVHLSHIINSIPSYTVFCLIAAGGQEQQLPARRESWR